VITVTKLFLIEKISAFAKKGTKAQKAKISGIIVENLELI